jgi:hypothetical protein
MVRRIGREVLEMMADEAKEDSGGGGEGDDNDGRDGVG